MKFEATGKATPIAWAEDSSAIDIEFEGVKGEGLVMTFPWEHLTELSLIAVQLASLGCQKANRPFEPPVLSVEQLAAGLAQSGDIALKLEYPSAGAHAFRLNREMAGALRDALTKLLAQPGN